jgi:hypothetical protein
MTENTLALHFHRFALGSIILFWVYVFLSLSLLFKYGSVETFVYDIDYVIMTIAMPFVIYIVGWVVELLGLRILIVK